ncbi:pantoate--beta-alanine ligase [Bacillus suaedae]|uniref:Pantothenate synthetase n=1 Tax=Halalkalibacter suaedae TaxID=2822140 RepID=A0A941AN87_9BACI|nr:pantoate--beta-alanine ligase [Bacillus suaedae]MBP3950621.1 pantoate--beta-alanine ligase [Bacillus suaedae]
MKIIKTISELRTCIQQERSFSKSIGFVPTMGFLHEGHQSLLQHARENNDVVVLSIFVNPLQFGVNEDLDRYPRDFERDEQIATKNGVDILFYPAVAEMYPKEMPMTITVTKGVDVLCGQSRPGHFDGVATVVMKLFQLVQPTNAYFGQKDAQQLAIIMNMVESFNIPVTVIPCPTIREVDGLAKSSRNVYLTERERIEAPFLYKTLQEARALIQAGETNRTKVVDMMKRRLAQGLGQIDYVEVLSYPDLEIDDTLKGQIIIALAYRYEHARLIDNDIIHIKEEE